MKYKEMIEKTVEVDGIEYDVELLVSFYLDKGYGSDADGNRAEPRTFIEDVEIIKVMDGQSEVSESLELYNKILNKINIE